jgi:hypothetical protein
MPYTDPGDAFSQGYNGFLMQQQELARQQANDARLAQHQANEDALAKEALNEKRIQNQAVLDEKEKKATQEEVANMAPGDIVSGELNARTQRHHIPLKLKAPEMQPPPVPAALAAEGETNVEQPTTAPEGGPAPTEGAPQAIKAPELGGGMPSVYAGSAQDEEIARQKKALLEYADSIEATDPGSAKEARFKAQTMSRLEPKGANLPAGAFKIAGVAADTVPVMRVNPRTGTVEQIGTAPKGSHFATEPPPKADNGAAEYKAEQQRIHAYDVATRVLDKIEEPTREHVKKLNSLGVALNQMTPQADAIIAPLVIGATISGMGTGFRMTQGEINKVEGARSGWENLKAKLQHWDTDPSQALLITDDQRALLRRLAVAIRAEETKFVSKINKGREDILNANNPREIERAMNTFHSTMLESNEEETGPKGKSSKTPEDYLNEAGIGVKK